MKFSVLAVIMASMAFLSGCGGLGFSQRKRSCSMCPPNSICYTNATIIEIKNENETLGFVSPGVKAVKKKTCELVIKTDQNEVFTRVQEGYVECAAERLNQRVTIYSDSEGIAGVNWKPDPYIEEKYAPKPLK